MGGRRQPLPRGHSVLRLLGVRNAPALLILGALLAGVGHGLAILAAQDNLTRIAPEAQRAERSAAFYVCVYAEIAGPVIGIGVLAAAVSYTAVSVFAAATGAVALVVAGWHLRHRDQDERFGAETT